MPATGAKTIVNLFSTESFEGHAQRPYELPTVVKINALTQENTATR